MEKLYWTSRVQPLRCWRDENFMQSHTVMLYSEDASSSNFIVLYATKNIFFK